MGKASRRKHERRNASPVSDAHAAAELAIELSPSAMDPIIESDDPREGAVEQALAVYAGVTTAELGEAAMDIADRHSRAAHDTIQRVTTSGDNLDPNDPDVNAVVHALRIATLCGAISERAASQRTASMAGMLASATAAARGQDAPPPRSARRAVARRRR